MEDFKQTCPCKIFAFMEDADGEKLALIHACNWENKDYSVLMRSWTLEYANAAKTKAVYHLVKVEAIQQPVFMVPAKGGTGIVRELIHHDLWADQF